MKGLSIDNKTKGEGEREGRGRKERKSEKNGHEKAHPPRSFNPEKCAIVVNDCVTLLCCAYFGL